MHPENLRIVRNWGQASKQADGSGLGDQRISTPPEMPAFAGMTV